MKLLIRVLRAAAILGLVSGIGGASAAAQDRPAGTAYGSNAAAGQASVLDRTRFSYESYGRGEPLLLIRGNGESITSFKGQIGALARRHQVIAMDSRGQGRSERGTAKLSYEQMAEDVNGLLEHLKLERVKVLGWSDGGIIGLLLAIHYPEEGSKLAAMGAKLEPEAAHPWAVEGIVKVRQRLTTQLTNSKNPETLKFQLELLERLGNEPHIPLSDLSKIEIPTLVMAGDCDVIRNDHTLSMFHALPKSQLAIFPGASHMVPEQDPLFFDATVLRFFDTPFTMPDSRNLGWFD